MNNCFSSVTLFVQHDNINQIIDQVVVPLDDFDQLPKGTQIQIGCLDACESFNITNTTHNMDRNRSGSYSNHAGAGGSGEVIIVYAN